MVSNTPPAKGEDRRHLHVKVRSEETMIYDLITLYLEVAGKAPDWYWRTVGRLEGEETETMEDLIASAFEAGAYAAREHPDKVVLEWVTPEECEKQRKAETRNAPAEDAKQKERGALSHYA